MPIQFACARCGRVLEAGDEEVGRPVRCPHCAKGLAVPAAGRAPEIPTHVSISRGITAKPTAPPGAPVEPAYVPGRKTGSATSVLVVMSIILALVIIPTVVFYGTRPGQAVKPHLPSSVKYQSATDKLVVINDGSKPWQDGKVSVYVAQAVYIHDLADLAAGETAEISLRSFSGAQGQPPLDPFARRPDRVEISATLPGRVRASRSFNWMASAGGESEPRPLPSPQTE